MAEPFSINSYLLISSLLILSYLLGSIPSGFLLGKIIKKIDIRQYGSGNVGATNALRVLGWKIGIVSLIFDMLKGLMAVVIARRFLSGNNYAVLGCGLAAITGHIFTVFLKFKGGKGVATSAGVFIALTPAASVIALAVFIIVAGITRYVSVGSISAAIVLVISQFIITSNNHFNNIENLFITLLVAFFIIFKHKDNIKRLMEGKENKISFK